MLKKNIIITVSCMALVLFLFVFLHCHFPSFITQKGENIDKITIMRNYDGKEEEITIQNVKEKERIYNLLKKTSNLRTNKYPNHAESVQWDPTFIIYLEYQDGEKDIYFATERRNGILRLLNSKGASGDRGYISGTNEEIYEYVFR